MRRIRRIQREQGLPVQLTVNRLNTRAYARTSMLCNSDSHTNSARCNLWQPFGLLCLTGCGHVASSGTPSAPRLAKFCR